MTQPPWCVLWGLCVLLIVLALASSSQGAVTIPSTLWWQWVRSMPLDAEQTFWRDILRDVRLPRLFLAVVVGAALALAGAALQALFRNPLAEPSLLGVSAGASLGAVTAIVMFGSDFYLLAGMACIGSLLATLLVFALGSRQSSTSSLLLAGIAINAICGSVIGVFSYVADEAQLRSLTFWNMGSLAGAEWPEVLALGLWVGLMSVLIYQQWRAMNALLLGEREAGHLGFSLKVVRRRLVLLVALLVGPVVALSGIIGFVGLVVPHLMRQFVGANHRFLLPASLLAGAITLTLADWVARCIVLPAEMPIGIITSLVGAPFFLLLILHRRKPSC